MKSRLVLFVISFVFIYSANAAETQTMRLYNGNTKKYDDKKMMKVKNTWVSDTCEKKKTCDALKSLDKKVALAPSANGLAGNPGSSYCLQKGGVARILKDTQNNEYDYCLFKDGTLIDSWNLYSAHYAPNTTK